MSAADSPNRLRVRVFAITWLAYATYYLGRKNLAVSKTAIEETVGLTASALGSVDTVYLAAYAVGQFAMGALADRLGPRRTVGAGMLMVAVLVGACASAGSLAPFLILWALNGFFQASGWPGNIKAMTPWFTSTERGRVMGLWTTCYQVGGIAAGAVAARLVARAGWPTAFRVPALAVALVGILVLVALPEKRIEASAAASKARLDLLRVPTLWFLGAAYFCLKLIRYSLLFWLPYYLERTLGYERERAGYQSLAFEAGGAVGSVVVGYVSDRLLRGRRGLAGLLGCSALVGALLLFGAVGRWSGLANGLALALVGMCLFGPDALVSGAAAQELGGAEASATAAGFINGMGSVGAILQGALTTWVAAALGWDRVFSVLALLAAIAALVLLPLARSEGRPRPAPQPP